MLLTVFCMGPILLMGQNSPLEREGIHKLDLPHHWATKYNDITGRNLAQKAPPDCDICDTGRVIGFLDSGETRQYPSIQKALLAARTESVYRVVVCEGTYDETPVLAEFSDLTLEACGAVQVNGFILKDVVDITIDGFYVNADQRWFGIGLGFGSSFENDRITIRNCVIEGSMGSGIALRPWNHEVIVEGCILVNNRQGVDTIMFGGPYLFRANLLANNWIGAQVSAEAEITFEANHMARNQYFAIARLKQWDNADYPWMITLIRNTFEGNGGYVVPGTHDANLGNYHLIIDSTDDQPGYR